MDAEFAKPWLIHRLDRAGKEIMIDLSVKATVYAQNPKLRRQYNTGKSGKHAQLRVKAKPLAVGQWFHSLPGKKWRIIKVRDSSKGILEVSAIRRKVWLVDEETDEPRLFQLIVRRDPCETSESGYTYKFSLSNAKRDTLKRLAYKQGQRFWVEQAIKDSKQGAGMAEYQVRLWRGWHHHVSMSILVSLFMLEMRLKFGPTITLLSVNDVRELLISLLPSKNSFADRYVQMKKRHKQRRVTRMLNTG